MELSQLLQAILSSGISIDEKQLIETIKDEGLSLDHFSNDAVLQGFIDRLTLFQQNDKSLPTSTAQPFTPTPKKAGKKEKQSQQPLKPLTEYDDQVIIGEVEIDFNVDLTNPANFQATKDKISLWFSSVIFDGMPQDDLLKIAKKAKQLYTQLAEQAAEQQRAKNQSHIDRLFSISQRQQLSDHFRAFAAVQDLKSIQQDLEIAIDSLITAEFYSALQALYTEAQITKGYAAYTAMIEAQNQKRGGTSFLDALQQSNVPPEVYERIESGYLEGQRQTLERMIQES